MNTVTVSDAIAEEEVIFLLVKNKKKSNYLKLSFKYNDEYHLTMIKEAVSAEFKSINVDECEFFWEDILIAEEDLVALVKAKKSCSDFKLIVKQKGGQEDSDESDFEQGGLNEALQKKCRLNALNFREFINSDVQTRILLEQDALELVVRRSIIDCALKYLFKECGKTPHLLQREYLSKVICEVFIALKPSEPLVFKWIQRKYNNFRKKMRQLDRNKTASKRSADHLYSMDVIEAKIEFLETRLEPDDIPGIETALKETLKYRIEKYGNGDFSVFDTYKFFSKSLDLILYDFRIRFPLVPENLLDNLEAFLDAGCSVYKSETNMVLPEEDCLMGIRKLLCVCHYTKTPSCSLKPSYTLKEMMDGFIMYLTMDEDKSPEFLNHPMIVAHGSSKKAIWKYSIQIGDVLLQLPHQTKCIGAVDYLLRCYYVFNVDFPRILSVFFNFLMVNVYRISIKSKYDQKKPKIENYHTRPREFLRKVQKCLQLRNEI